MPPGAKVQPRAAAVAVFLLSFGSIWTLLGALWRLAPMHQLGLALMAPSLVGLVLVHGWARRAGHDTLDRAMTAGWWGGWWGTLGYDLVRVPFHYLGYNPFPPIRSYGMFLINAPHATVASDVAGVVYHFSNGLTFGVMYAVVMWRRHWGWAVLWGLLLETFAVVTPFGAIYGLRTHVAALSIAYFAHLYYGLPLGVAVADPERFTRWVARPWVRWTTVALTATVAAFLVLAWEPVGASRPEPGTVDLGPDAMVAGWTRVAVSSPLTLHNADDAALTWSVGDQRGTLAPGATHVLTFERAGILPLRVDDRPWRSVLLSVERDGYPAEPGTW